MRVIEIARALAAHASRPGHDRLALALRVPAAAHPPLLALKQLPRSYRFATAVCTVSTQQHHGCWTYPLVAAAAVVGGGIGAAAQCAGEHDRGPGVGNHYWCVVCGEAHTHDNQKAPPRLVNLAPNGLQYFVGSSVLLHPYPVPRDWRRPVTDGKGNSHARNGNAYIGWVCSNWQRKQASGHHHSKEERRGLKREAGQLADTESEKPATRSDQQAVVERLTTENAQHMEQIAKLSGELAAQRSSSAEQVQQIQAFIAALAEKDRALHAARAAHQHLGATLLDTMSQLQAAQDKVTACSQQIATLAEKNEGLLKDNRLMKEERDKALAHKRLQTSKLSQQRTLHGTVISSITSPALLYEALHLKYKEDGTVFDVTRQFKKPLAQIGDRHARRFMEILRPAANVLLNAMHPNDRDGQVELLYADLHSRRMPVRKKLVMSTIADTDLVKDLVASYNSCSTAAEQRRILSALSQQFTRNTMNSILDFDEQVWATLPLMR